MAIQAQYSDNFVGLSLCGMENGNNGGGFGFCDWNQSLYQQQQVQGEEDFMMSGGGGGGGGGGAQNQQWRNQSLGLGQVVDPSSSMGIGFLNQGLLGLQAEKQRQEIDRFIALQNERLRAALQEQRKQQLSVLLTRLESKAVHMVRQKDEEIAKARRKAMELEDCIRKFEIETQAWQRVAKENESMAIALNKTLEQVKENVCMFSNGGGGGVEDAESCCQSNSHQEGESVEMKKRMVCKGCNSQTSCVLFLPCRHLCACKDCEAFLDSCPVCKSVKKACIEVFMS